MDTIPPAQANSCGLMKSICTTISLWCTNTCRVHRIYLPQDEEIAAALKQNKNLWALDLRERGSGYSLKKDVATGQQEICKTRQHLWGSFEPILMTSMGQKHQKLISPKDLSKG